MNSTFYIFGKFNGSYAQFPVDYTQDIFQQLPNRSSFSNTQLVIHRDNNLMYYCYMRKLEQDNFIGFCLLLNDAMIEEIPALFDHFDQAVTQLALKGEIIKINDQGDVVSNTDSLLTNQQAIKQTASSLFAQLSSLVAAKKTLPTQTFACDRDETKTFMLTANNISWILESSLRNAYTIITKEDNSSNLDTYQQTIKRLQKEKEELLAQKKPTHLAISKDAIGMFIVSIITVFIIYTYSNNQAKQKRTSQPKIEYSEVRSNTTTSVQNTYTPNSSVQTSSVPTNSTERIKQNRENKILAETADALYYLGEKSKTLYRFDKRDLSTQTFAYDTTEMGNHIDEALIYDDMLIIIGWYNASVHYVDGDVALFFNTKSRKFEKELFASRIERKGDVLVLKQEEVIIFDGLGINGHSKYFYWNEYYDLRGNLIDGQTIRGKGYIGKYPIEISMHCLKGEITGWYKYKGHTNYMTIKGRINEYNKFTFVEYNEKGERFGTFEGYADFQSQTLNGYFRKGGLELNFSTSDSETW